MELFEKIYWHKRGLLLAFVQAGGAHLVTTGSDHPSWGDYLAGFAIHREMHAMVLSGLSPAQALRCATINGARALRMDDQVGSLEVGKLADVVIINQDILAAAHTLDSPEGQRVQTEAAYGICDAWIADHCRTDVEQVFIGGTEIYSNRP